MKSNIKYRFLIFIAIIYPFFPLMKEWSTSSGNILELIIIFMLSIVTIVTIDNSRIILKLSVSHILLLLLLVFYTLLSSNIVDGFSAFRIFLLYIILYDSLIEISSKQQIQQIISAIIIVGVIMALGALIQFAFPDIIKSFHNPSAWYDLGAKTNFIPFNILNRAVSFLNDPNVLGVYISSVIILIFEASKYVKIRYIKSILLIMCISIISSQSRTAIFILLIYFILKSIVWLFGSNQINIFWLLSIGLVIVVVMILLYKNITSVSEYLRVNTLLNGNGRVSRNHLYVQNLLAQNTNHLLFGNGLTVGRSGMVFENIYLMFFYSFGFIGCIILTIFMILSFKKIFILSNTIPIICYLIINYVGDYFFIPLISIIYLFIFTFNLLKKTTTVSL